MVPNVITIKLLIIAKRPNKAMLLFVKSDPLMSFVCDLYNSLNNIIICTAKNTVDKVEKEP